jgi:potassium large conductance calcium-activated channel subfamily M alpha protein 1
MIKYAGERSRFSVVLEWVVFFVNAVYLILYVARTYYGIIAPTTGFVLGFVIVECCCSVLLVVPLIERILQAKRPLLAWFSYFTIIDVLTLPHPFVSLIFSCDWVGLRNLRFLALNAISKVLVQVRIINSPLVADATSLLVTFLTIWLTASGMVYLLEVSGDPWDNFSNAQNAYYLEYVYFAMTTMTTVGYGDISPKTAFGRVFVTFFMIAGLALFALALGPITDYLAADKKYYTWYSIDPTRPHIVVCGDIDHNRMHRILGDFLHPDRVSVLSRPDIVFLMKDFPSADTKHVIHRHFPHAFYLVGSMFKLQDLQRVQLSHAAACIIMTDTSLQDQDASDGTAIMRYIAVKNYTTDVRIIMQVSQSSTLRKLEVLPAWNPEKDLVWCINEWRLGWLSAACYCQGLSTVLGNLLCPVSLPRKVLFSKEPSPYMEGASLEIYCTMLPDFLASREARDVIQICRFVCDLTLIALEFDGQLHTNPAAEQHLVIQPNTLGYFIAENRGDLKTLVKIKPFLTQNYIVQALNPITQVLPEGLEGEPKVVPLTMNGSALPLPPTEKSLPEPAQLKDHYVLCIFANKKSPAVDLVPFCQPLLQTPDNCLVIVTGAEYSKKLAATDAMKMFANAHIMVGSPLDVESLERAGVSNCKYCALMTVHHDRGMEEPALVDKQVILCLRLLEGMQHKSGGKVPFVVELLEEDNVQFVYLDDEDEGVDQVQLSTPYAWGSVVTMGMVDLLMATSFYNVQSTKIVQRLVKNPSVTKIPITDLPSHVSTFIEAFEHILKNGHICIGVMRLANSNLPTSYYPITAPKSSCALEPTDLLLVLQ